MSAPLLAVDAPSMLFRAFYALPKSIKGADGRPVNALLGTANLILREVERHEPRAVVLCFGPDAADYRVELFSGYHVDRDEPPDELAPQFDDAGEFFGSFGWVIAVSETLEADDLLGSFARVEEEAGGRALVMTGDRDMSSARPIGWPSCTSGRVTRGEEIGPPRWSVATIPARPPTSSPCAETPRTGSWSEGVSEKTAAELLRKHGSLDGVLDNAIAITKPRLRTTLLDSRDELLTFREIATLRDGKVKRPRDRELDRAGAARAARERG